MASACKRIHILGFGSLGKLTAHSLATSKSASVTLLLHRPELVDQWKEAGERINVVTNEVPNIRGGFQYEKTSELENERANDICNLIVATKTYATTEALRPLRHRLNPASTIVFLQNGMGTVEEVTKSLFPASTRRPHCYTGIVTHGVYSTGAFAVVHAGQGSLRIGAVRQSQEPGSSTESTTRPESPNFLLQCLREAPALYTSLVSKEEILQIQLQKLAINATINPLTVIFDCINGELFVNSRRVALLRRLLTEISPVISAVLASSYAQCQNGEALSSFTLSALEQVVLDAAVNTSQNISSMRQDMMAGRTTEIDYINGYVVAQGAKIGLDCSTNRTLIQLVKNHKKIVDNDIPVIFPDVSSE